MNLTYLATSRLVKNRANTIQTLAMLKTFVKANPETIFVTASNQSKKFITKETKIKNSKIFRINANNSILFFKTLFSQLKKQKIKKLFSRASGDELIFALMGISIISEIHDIPKTLKTKIYLWTFSRIPKVKAIIVISDGLKQKIKKYVPLKKLVVLHDGVHIDSIEKYPKNIPSINNCDIGYFGSFKHGKGVDKVIELAMTCKIANFSIYGGTFADFQKYYPTIRKIPHNVKFLGKISHEKSLSEMKRFNILILPNTQNNPLRDVTSPLKLFEYMSSGILILSSPFGSINEILKDKYNCLMFNPSLPEDLNKTLQFAIDNRSNIMDIIYNALEDVKNYSWEKRTNTILELF